MVYACRTRSKEQRLSSIVSLIRKLAVGDKVLVHYGQERNGNATAFKVEAPDKDINEDTGGSEHLQLPHNLPKKKWYDCSWISWSYHRIVLSVTSR